MTDTTINLSTLQGGTVTSQFDGLLKDVYLPGLTDTVFNDPSFTALIQSSAQNIDYKGQRVIRAFKKQRAGGVGAIAEGGSFVSSVPQKGKQGWEQIKYLNAYFEITGPAILAAQSGEGSFVDAANQSFEDMMTNAKNDMERQIMGSGNGTIATISSVSTVTLDVDGDPYFDTQHVTPGMWVDIYDTGDYTTKVCDGFQVVSITKGDKVAGTKGQIVLSSSAAAANALDVVVRKGAYTAAGVCLEINGLGNLVNTGRTIWNLADSSETYLQSIVKTVGQELDEELLLGYLLDMQYQHQADPNLLLVSPRAMLKYFTNVKDDRRFNTMGAMQWVGGYTGLGIQLGNKQLMLTTVGSCPNTTMFMLNTSDFAFASMTNGYKWLNNPNGGILTQKEASDNQFATAVNYVQFICNDPGRQFRGNTVTV